MKIDFFTFVIFGLMLKATGGIDSSQDLNVSVDLVSLFHKLKEVLPFSLSNPDHHNNSVQLSIKYYNQEYFKYIKCIEFLDKLIELNFVESKYLSKCFKEVSVDTILELSFYSKYLAMLNPGLEIKLNDYQEKLKSEITSLGINSEFYGEVQMMERSFEINIQGIIKMLSKKVLEPFNSSTNTFLKHITKEIYKITREIWERLVEINHNHIKKTNKNPYNKVKNVYNNDEDVNNFSVINMTEFLNGKTISMIDSHSLISDKTYGEETKIRYSMKFLNDYIGKYIEVLKLFECENLKAEISADKTKVDELTLCSKEILKFSDTKTPLFLEDNSFLHLQIFKFYSNTTNSDINQVLKNFKNYSIDFEKVLDINNTSRIYLCLVDFLKSEYGSSDPLMEKYCNMITKLMFFISQIKTFSTKKKVLIQDLINMLTNHLKSQKQLCKNHRKEIYTMTKIGGKYSKAKHLDFKKIIHDNDIICHKSFDNIRNLIVNHDFENNFCIYKDWRDKLSGIFYLQYFSFLEYNINLLVQKMTDKSCDMNTFKSKQILYLKLIVDYNVIAEILGLPKKKNLSGSREKIIEYLRNNNLN